MISVTSDSSRFTRYGDLLVAVFIVFSVMMMIIPLPASLLSFLLIINITLSLLILLEALFTHEVLDFSVFPALLLVMTLFRLC